jgi:exodeoxyribonuclease-3
MPFSLATWNINSVRLRARLVEKFLRQWQPDVLCLQEIKCLNDQFPAKPFRKLGYEHQVVHGQKGYHGVAILSRRPLTEIERRDFCGVGDSRHLHVELEVGGRRVRLHNFYVPAGGDVPDPALNPKFDHKLRFVDEMRRLDSRGAGMPNLLVGDLNIAPLEHDVWSHRQLLDVVSHTPVETEALTAMQQGGGWRDLMRQTVPANQKLYSWWSYRAHDWLASNRGRRLDHIWAEEELAKSLVSLEVLRDARGWRQPSDHVPVVARFELD